MKLLKRNLAFVLTLAMVLGLMVSASALNIKDYSDYNEITYLEAIDLLTSLGILEGTDGKFNPQDVLTREQGAKIIAYLMLGKDGAEALSTSVAPFKDVASGRWSAGFIAYCASQGIIGGYGNGNFGPTDKLTGNQFAKMLLVALGYGVNGEFTGPNWSIEVAKYALTEGIFDGNLGANFDAGTKREEAALYAFNALTGVMTVSYSETFGTYYSGKLFNSVDKFDEEYTLGYKLYNVKSKDTTDDFGREAHYWVKNSNTKLTETYHEEADAVYTAQVTSAKVYTDLGLTKTVKATVIEDGKTAGTFQIEKGLTSQNKGGNGVLIEAYVDEDENVTLVLINTYLAQVSNVDDGTVTVSFLYNNVPANTDNKFDTAVEYAEDDYVLVTVADGDIQSMVAAESKTGKITAYATNYVKLDDEKINKSAQLKKAANVTDDTFVANDYDSELRVILDEYGYAAAVVMEEEADANYSYVLVTDSEGRTDSLLSGKAAVVKVMYLDGKSEVLPLETKKENSKTYFKLDTGVKDASVWQEVKVDSGNTAPLMVGGKSINGWYRYTLKDSGEIVLKALKADKAIGGTNVAFDNTTAKQKITVTGLKDNASANLILNSKSVLHVVSENSTKTYTGYKNINKNITGAKALFLIDGSLATDIYVLDTDVSSEDVYGYYNGTKYSNSKADWATLYVDGEAHDYQLTTASKAALDSKGIYKLVIDDSDNELTSVTLVQALSTKNSDKTTTYHCVKVTSAQEAYFQTGVGTMAKKHYYDEDVKVYDVTDDGKPGNVAKNDYVLYIPTTADSLVTYVYIVAEPDTTTPGTVVGTNYTVTSNGSAVTITAPTGVTVNKYLVKVERLIESSDRYVTVEAAKEVATGTNLTVARDGVYRLTITAVVGENNAEVEVGTYEFDLIATIVR